MSSAKKIRLSSYDDLFGDSDSEKEHVQEIAISELHEFHNHPFRVMNDEKMIETVESVKQYGVLVPGIVRPRVEGGYEILSGHRRRYACQLAGLSTMPVFVRDCSDDEATEIMVDSNIQREDILPSEKAKAYRMKYEARKHQGSKAGGATLKQMGEEAGESGKTIQRYIWLSRLNNQLLDLVDAGKLGLVQGVDISFLSEEEQGWIWELFEETGLLPNGSQASKMKEESQNGNLTYAMVRVIICDLKPKQIKLTIRQDRLSEYFGENYSVAEAEEIIYQLLDAWKNKG